MPKKKRSRIYDFGRLFFPEPHNPIPREVRFQPLGNHVKNVMQLVKWWKAENFPFDSSRQRVLEAAKIHDMGKPQQFEIKVQTDARGEFKHYIYSFKGHRFLAESKDEWAQTLAIGHHDFSIADITRDAYRLKKQQPYAEKLAKDPLAYARELYILEMCDQIEAELACRAIGDEEQAESRAFMDYTIAADSQDTTQYFLDPWPFFHPSIQLTFHSWSMELTPEDKAKLEQCQKDKKDLGKTLDNIAKSWWESYPENRAKQPIVKVTVKPYPDSVDDGNHWDCRTCYQQLASFEPNPMQDKMYEAIARQPNPAILLKAPTGVGKLEAVLFPALASNYRLILPLPARSLLEDHKQRVEQYLKRFSQLHPRREFSLVVDTGTQMHRWVYKGGQEVPRRINPRRHLYKGDVILTTLDKFLYRYFAFGDKQKSFIFPLRIHQEKTLICFDEAHSYDEVAFTNFRSLVQSLYTGGRSLVLMTATMPPEYLEEFARYLQVFDYMGESEYAAERKKLAHFEKPQRGFEWLASIERNPREPEAFQTYFREAIMAEVQAKPNCRLIAVVQTVKDAAAIYQQLKGEAREPLFLYHGRLDSRVRQQVYEGLKEHDEAGKPYRLITTSAIEVGCDLNCEILMSEICPPENLIQQVGRCNRKGNIADAKVVVIGRIVGDRIPFYGQTLDENGWAEYQDCLQSLTHFDGDKIAQFIRRSHRVDDYRVVELFSMLHDYVYGADLTYKPLHEKGLVVTRSWTPSATLVYDDGTHGDDIHKMPQASVPLDRLIQNKENQYANTHVFERYYNRENTCWELRDLRPGYAYAKTILIKISATHEGALMPEAQPEYQYQADLGFLELPGVFIKLKPSGLDDKLLYKREKTTAILTYPGSLTQPS
ncbi:CRISPR-associated helicase Cas3' [Phormidium sp. CCY1219]|uniref:CRISPR-associated helicase Cas3' n=1 Tax=Phormidium sp. CCY1219 TaxID=2886104 RepID=UPI002D1E593A|nr:CRISPR-associated helicase Cas3' [Phormidium sp. CCY1219]MEB3828065.1 CRISPR-associated helicase Cas3' [Phormidium sp. CCY1219]